MGLSGPFELFQIEEGPAGGCGDGTVPPAFLYILMGNQSEGLGVVSRRILKPHGVPNVELMVGVQRQGDAGNGMGFEQFRNPFHIFVRSRNEERSRWVTKV